MPGPKQSFFSSHYSIGTYSVQDNGYVNQMTIKLLQTKKKFFWTMKYIVQIPKYKSPDTAANTHHTPTPTPKVHSPVRV